MWSEPIPFERSLYEKNIFSNDFFNIFYSGFLNAKTQMTYTKKLIFLVKF